MGVSGPCLEDKQTQKYHSTEASIIIIDDFVYLFNTEIFFAEAI